MSNGNSIATAGLRAGTMTAGMMTTAMVRIVMTGVVITGEETTVGTEEATTGVVKTVAAIAGMNPGNPGPPDHF